MSGRAIGWVFDNSPMSGAALLVQVALADVANDMHDNELWCSTLTLSRKCRCSRFTVTRALADLVGAKQLEVIAERPGRSTRYRMLFFTPATTSGTPVDDLPPELAAVPPDVAATCHEVRHELNRTQANNFAPPPNFQVDLEDFSWVDEEPAPREVGSAHLDAILSRFHKRADLA